MVTIVCSEKSRSYKIIRHQWLQSSYFEAQALEFVSLVLYYNLLLLRFLANVNSRSRSLYAIVRPSVCRLSVCLSSVTLVRPTQAVQIFRNISTTLGTLAILDIC